MIRDLDEAVTAVMETKPRSFVRDRDNEAFVWRHRPSSCTSAKLACLRIQFVRGFRQICPLCAILFSSLSANPNQHVDLSASRLQSFQDAIFCSS